MDFKAYIHALRDGWVLLLTTVIIGALLGAGISSQLARDYVATSQLFVSTAGASGFDFQGGSQFAERRLFSYAKIATAQTVTSNTIKALGLDMSQQELAGKITASPIPNTTILSIAVSDDDPAEARRIANEVTQQLANEIPKLEPIVPDSGAAVIATIISRAPEPESRTGVSILRGTAIGAGLGLILGMLAAILRFMTSSRIRSIGKVTEAGAGPVLSTIPAKPDQAQLQSAAAAVRNRIVYATAATAEPSIALVDLTDGHLTPPFVEALLHELRQVGVHATAGATFEGRHATGGFEALATPVSVTVVGDPARSPADSMLDTRTTHVVPLVQYRRTPLASLDAAVSVAEQVDAVVLGSVVGSAPKYVADSLV
ncbi:hypothetical protein MUG78_01030 [Gordonia alkaliphila]|uniref:YveK family protein n=1 Tax=Gordonia alkaliphila TaxID=1053547 RepID=UPI001FF3B406|nr:hypothetical protein [Gordonia alkaliphila]MCK0438078.1 hypothetical protein [Gordonia alkaliphila]